MKKTAIPLIIFVMTLFCLSGTAATYSTLWKQYETVRDKDLPQDMVNVLDQIIAKATTAKDYGQLLKAQILRMDVRSEISPDSLSVDIQRMKQWRSANHDVGSNAIIDCVFALNADNMEEEGLTKAQIRDKYTQRALENADKLAGITTSGYEPTIVAEEESRVFNHDLLHVVGLTLQKTDFLHTYYIKKGNRPAACITALYLLQQQKKDFDKLQKSKYVQSLDSLMKEYDDLRECGELAIERYDCMVNCSDVSQKDRYDFINYALAKWGEWPRMNILRNARNQLTLPSFTMNINEMVLPNTDFDIFVRELVNIRQLTVSITRVNVEGDTKLSATSQSDLQRLQKLADRTPAFQTTHNYYGHPNFEVLSDTIKASGLKTGMYLVEATGDAANMKYRACLLHVSDVFVMHQPLPDNKHRFVVVSATTGQPLPDAELKITTNGKSAAKTLKTDNKGELVWTSGKRDAWNTQVFPTVSGDQFTMPLQLGESFSNWKQHAGDRQQYQLYTDRAIYRPGQTVHVAAILFEHKTNNDDHAVEGKEFEISLRDANYEKIQTVKVKTDEYGTAHTDFVLPQTGLTGWFSVTCNGASTGFNVEEYKRPTFEVTFDKVTESYKAGDTITVKGHARSFAGMPVIGAKVNYNVVRRPLWWWYSNGSEQITTDSCLTDDNGDFLTKVVLSMPDEGNRRSGMFNFVVNADVTTSAGETQNAQTAIPAGTKETQFTVNLPERVRRDSLKTITFSLVNAANQPVDRTVTYHLEGIEKTFTAQTNKETQLTAPFTTLKSGRYKLLAASGTDTLSKEFVVFDISDKHPATTTKEWFWTSADQFPRDGRPVYVQVGSSDKDVHVCYTFISGSKVLESGTMDMDNAIKTYKINYDKEYGDQLEMNFAWVKDGVCHLLRHEIRKPQPADKLDMKWSTFRDKVRPGDEETWTLNIKHPAKGKDIFYDEEHATDVPTGIQLMAVLYDKSLDTFSPLQWALNIPYYRNVENSRWEGSKIDLMSFFGEQSYKDLEEHPLVFSHIDDQLLNFYTAEDEVFFTGYGRPRLAMRKAKGVMALAATNEIQADAAVADSTILGMAPQAIEEKAVQEKPSAQQGNPSLRENLNETAFFYPTLMADENGDVNISFRLPESVTTWKFMGLAHDKNMNRGMLEGETVAQKQLMVQPNMPRFVREGDEAQLSATITNTTDQRTSGEATLEILDAETEKTVFTQRRSFRLGTKSEPAAVVTFNVPQLSPNIYVARIIAETRNGSDGEQHYLPVLSNREYVTNTVAFTQNGKGTKTIDLSKLVPEKASVTVEYTNNPAWLMIQTLNYVSDARDNDAISQATALYANSLGRWIMNSNPNIKTIVKDWQQNQEKNLTSSLQTNSELKNLELNDTPWMQEAKGETQQMRSLANFFDENTLNFRLKDNLSKLKRLQNADGSFSWWPGMTGSPYMTVAVSVILSRLNDMTGMQGQNEDIINAAYSYLKKEIAKEVVELKKEAKKGAKDLRPSEMACNFLYLSAINNEKTTSDIDYLVDLIAKHPTWLTIYGKSMGAIILNHFGHKQEALTNLKSIDQYSVYKEEMGRYFDTPKAQYSWRDYKIPSQVAAIEAFQRLDYRKGELVPDMQRWLLQEKRTQLWDTPINTADAVYGFLRGNTTQPLAVKEQTVLKIDDKTLSNEGATAGLGYVKDHISDIKPRTFTAEKTTDGTSWGAVYAQFWQKSSDVASATNGMTLKRELLHSDGTPVKGDLKVGDKVKVRLTITADRDYDFVQVQDKRAACMEPVSQLSGYRWGYYLAPKDNVTNYYFDRMAKGRHVVETEYYIDRAGTYQTGVCTSQCAYSPAYGARTGAITICVK